MWELRKPLYLTDQEREALQEIVSAWREGLPSAEDATIQDRTLTTPEQLLSLTSFYRAQDDLLKRLLERIGEA